ncbi:MAG: hypothetical protein GC180_01295 [Bacteroidetes bacterium]|nr:hypothetical protein [Bacteroidota bacterium]
MNPKFKLWAGNALLAIAIGLIVGVLYPRLNDHKEATSGDREVIFDSLLAAKYQADEYGMRSYVMAFLMAGPNRSQSPEEAKKLQEAHLANIRRMAEEGKLVIAGPFLDDGDIQGVYVFAVADTIEARKLTETDPMIQSGRLIMELKPWYGSAALMGVNAVHERIAKENP